MSDLSPVGMYRDQRKEPTEWFIPDALAANWRLVIDSEHPIISHPVENETVYVKITEHDDERAGCRGEELFSAPRW